MAHSWKLQAFEPSVSVAVGSINAPGPDLEEVKLASFEQGYAAGWEDATTAYQNEQNHISGEFSRHLQEMSFSYHEARTAMLKESEGLFRQIVNKVLPDLAQPSLGEMIVERVSSGVAIASNITIEIVVSPENGPTMAQLLNGRPGPPIHIIEEPSLSNGQAFMKFGSMEEKIDLDQVIEEIALAIDQYFSSLETEEKIYAS